MSNPYAPPPKGGNRGPTNGPAQPGDPRRTPDGARPPHGPVPPGGAPRPPAQPERAPDPDAVRAASRNVMHFALLMLASLVTAPLPLPWQIGSLAFSVAAVVMGVRALIAVRRAGIKGAVLPAVTAGLLLAAALSGFAALTLALWPQQSAYQQCRTDALTISAREACDADYVRSLRDRLMPTAPSQG